MKRLVYVFIVIFASVNTSCDNNNSSNDDLVHIKIFYTNDEHGWMEPNDDYDGAPGLVNLWKTIEGYDGSDNYLIVSGGDMWTGPALSTWFQGESMVQVMNAMNYDVAAVGNHEFDYKEEGLIARSQQMNFPLVSANLVYKSNGEIPEYVLPYIIKEIEGVKLGIIGLSSLSTPYTAAPDNVVDFEFTSYSEALIEYAAEAKNEGAEILMVAGHICEHEMEELVNVAKENGISIIGGGHCHQAYAKEMNDVVLMQSGSNMRAYAKVEFDYKKSNSTMYNLNYEVVMNNQHNIDSDIQDIVDHWIARTEQELAEVIGYASETIYKSSPAMGNLVCDSWFYTFSHADISFTNSGGIRQDILQGDISLETIVGLLPFDNMIYELEFTGSEVMEVADDFLVGGMTTVGGYQLLDGTNIHVDSVYTVLTTDYLYSLTTNNMSEFDDTPINTYVNYRQPLIDWIKSLELSTTNPLNNYLDTEPRH